MSSFQCSVCIETCPGSRSFACPTCAYRVCRACQKAYLQPSCMNCRSQFTQRYMLDHLGASYVNTVLRRHQEQQFMERERALLPDMQEHVDRVRQARSDSELVRFGPLPRGAAAGAGAATAARPHVVPRRCPAAQCRGFVPQDGGVWGVCGVCGLTVCRRCGSAVEGDAHSCNPDDLASVALVDADSRACPSCSVMITRSAGCSHMRCTFCGTHFNWDTGHRIVHTTNHHYDRVALISADAADRAASETTRGVVGQLDGCAPSVADLELDRVPRDRQVLGGCTLALELVTSLYDDLAVVRFTRRSLFHGHERRHEDALRALRVRYLLGEIDDALWTRRVYALEKQRVRAEHVSHVLDLYVATARDFQLLLSRRDEGCAALHARWLSFVGLCNESLESLRAEFGGQQLLLRSRLSDPHQHPLLVA